jgi:hypothetical protein
MNEIAPIEGLYQVLLKWCPKCKLEKPVDMFGKSRRTKDGLRWCCKLCNNISSIAYNEAHPDQIIASKKLWRENNKDRILAKSRLWRHANKPKINAREKNRRLTDPQHKLSSNLRCRVNAAIKSGRKAGSAVRDCGCSMEFLKAYLEAKFQPGMSWGNWGRKGWHIDHITPLDAFDLTNREQFLTANHYTNLQPLWWQDNLSKHNSINL